MITYELDPRTLAIRKMNPKEARHFTEKGNKTLQVLI